MQSKNNLRISLPNGIVHVPFDVAIKDGKIDL